MRILLLNDDALPFARGGAAVIVDKLQRAYAAQGHETLLVTTHQKEGEGILRQDTVIRLPSRYPLQERHRHCLGDAAMSAILRTVFAEWKPDAVHAHNVHTHLTYESLRIAREFTEQIVLTAHDTFLASFARVSGPRFERLALQSKPMRMHWWEHLMTASRKYWPPRNAAIRTILRESGTQVIPISNAVAQFLSVNGIRTSAVIPNGIEPWETPSNEELARFRNAHGITDSVILFAGRVREDKGISALLATIPQVLREKPDAQFLICGVREDVEPFLSSMDDAARRAVRCTGWLSPAETRLAFFMSDIVTVPSLYLDNFPTVNLEAMMAGKPVVGTVFGGTPEIVANGKTGWIVNPRDTRTYTEKLLSLLKNLSLAREMGERGRERVRTAFGMDRQSAAYLRLLTDKES